MRKKLLSLLAMALMTIGINAQTWTEPAVPTEGSDPISGRIYRVKNVESGFYLAGGTVWFSWGTTAMLVDAEASDPISFTMTDEKDDEGNSLGWTFKGYDGNWPNNYVFVSGNGIDGFAMHVDNPTDVHRYFELLKQDNGNYRIRVAAQVDTYGEAAIEDWADRFWGWGGYEDATGQNFAVYASVKPENGFYCDWQFVDMTVYQAKVALYALAVQIEEEGLEVDYEPYTSAYEGNDVEAIQAAIDELKLAIGAARFAGLNDATEEDPIDATFAINNPEFYDCTNGNFPGWIIEAPNGGNTWKNGSDFVEYWNGTAANGQFDYWQEIVGLPAGKYTLTARMWNSMNGVGGTFEPTSGVYGTTSNGTVYALVDVDCDNNDLHEYTTGSIILAEGDVLRLGVKNVKTMVARWFGVDYIHMMYYGPVKEDPAKIALDELIAKLEDRYGDIDAVRADNEVKNAYEAALEAAKTESEKTDGDYQAATDALNEVAEALAASVAEYNKAMEKYAELTTQTEELAEQWPDLEVELSELLDHITTGYDEGTLTSEEIASMENDFMEIVFAFLRNTDNIKAGDDLTVLLTNPSFDTGNTDGWTSTGASPGFNTPTGNGVNTAEATADWDTSNWGMDCEVYHDAFDLSQVIKNMPAGLYKFTCQGFWRGSANHPNDSDNTPAQLYAVINGEEQTDNLANIWDYPTEEALYNGSGFPDEEAGNGSGWVPFGMSGAMYHFHNTHINDAGEDEFDYTSTLNIILTETSDITVGVRTTSKGTWVIFDNFKITYMGQSVDVFADVLKDLIAKAENAGLGDDDILTDEAQKKLEDAIDAGDAALKGTSVEDCQAAIKQLQEALAFAETTLKATALLQQEYDIMDQYRWQGLTSGDTTFPALMEEIGSAIDSGEFDDLAQVENFRQQLKSGFTTYVMFDRKADATEEDAVEVTEIIYNPDYQNYEVDGPNLTGWTVDGGAGFYETTSEFYNQNFSLSQTLYNLPKGFYRLHVPGFYRDGGYANVESILNAGDTETVRVALFAGDVTTKFLPITADIAAYNELGFTGATITVDEVAQNIPNGMGEAAQAFDNDLYQNIVQFEVAEDGTDVNIGIRKEETVGDDWTMFGAWTLYYLGTTEPKEDPTTAIQDMEVETAVKAAIFNLAGQRVTKAQKGVYIINGRKVVVK